MPLTVYSSRILSYQFEYVYVGGDYGDIGNSRRKARKARQRHPKPLRCVIWTREIRARLRPFPEYLSQSFPIPAESLYFFLSIKTAYMEVNTSNIPPPTAIQSAKAGGNDAGGGEGNLLEQATNRATIGPD